MIFKTILCPIDFSLCSEVALRFAVRLARDDNSRLAICHIVPDFLSIMGYPDRLPLNKPMILAEAQDQLKRFLAGKIPEGLSAKAQITIDSPPRAILQIARDAGCDLIVMGTHGRTGMERFFMGSTTYKVLHKSPIPVLTLRGSSQTAEPEREIRRILCAVDFEGPKPKLLRLLSSVAKRNESEILFLHVRHHGESEDRLQNEKANLENIMTDLAPDQRQVFIVEEGHVADQILITAEKLRIDLLFVGHHSRLPVEFESIGSVAGKVIAQASCPVMVVRE